MDVRSRGTCAVEILRGGQGRILLDATLHPDFVDPSLLPIGEQAHAVPSGGDVFEMLPDLRHRQVQIDVLPHRERGLEIQRDLGDNADGAEMDDRGLKRIAISGARDRQNIATGSHDLECRDRRREIPVLRAGAMCCGGTGTGD